MPLPSRHDYAAGFHRGLRAGDTNRLRSSPPEDGCARQPSPHPPGWSWWILLRSVQTLVSHVHLLVLLAEPEPSGSTGPSRRCRGCLPPSPVSPRSGCPQLAPTCCDRRAARVSHPRTVMQRLVALRVVDPDRVALIARPVGERAALRTPRPPRPTQNKAVCGENTPHRRR